MSGHFGRTAREIGPELGDGAVVCPTHGFGSFCSAGSSAGGGASTIGRERIRNDALVEPDERPSSRS
jgi:hydroxyacylglutathione hydrolase